MHTAILYITQLGLRISLSKTLKEHGIHCLYANSEKELLGLCAKHDSAPLLLHQESCGKQPQNLVAHLMEEHPYARVLILASLPHFPTASLLLSKGIRGYGNIHMASPVLLQALQIIESGGIWLAPPLMEQLIMELGKLSTPETPAADLSSLSERERETALLVAQGLGNKAIAEHLGITERTIKAHLGSIFSKLGLKDRLALALYITHPTSKE